MTTKNPQPPNMSEHPDDLLLPYVEGMLTEQQKADVEAHLSQCELCSSELSGLSRMIWSLKENKEVFCPNSAEIVGFVETGHDPGGVVSRHLESCSSCFQVAQACGAAASSERMPASLWNSIENRLAVSKRPGEARTDATEAGVVERLMSWLKMPAFAVGAAAAALLLVMLFYPPDVVGPDVGLSSVTWEGAPRPKALRPKVSFILFFKGVGEPFPQERIDAVYEALRPDMELSTHFDVVTPAEIRDAVRAREVVIRSASLNDTLASLHKKLDVAVAAMITVQPSNGKLSLNLELLDARTGSALSRKTVSEVSAASLARVIRQTVFRMILSGSVPSNSTVEGGTP